MSRLGKLTVAALAVIAVSVVALLGILYLDGMQTGLMVQRKAFSWSMPTHVIRSTEGSITVFEGGHGVPVVFVHGFSDQASTWMQVAPSFVNSHRVVAPDLPGHGSSQYLGGTLGFSQVYAGLDRVVKDLGGDGVVLVGNSLGGWLSLAYSLDHPERVRHLVLVNSAGLAQPLDKPSLVPTTRADLDSKLDAVFAAHKPNLPWFFKDQLVSMMNQPRYSSLFDDLMHGGHFLDDRVGQLSVPSTVIWGLGDGYFPIEYGRRLAGSMPGAELVELPGCGHAPQMTCPDEVVRVLRKSLAGIKLAESEGNRAEDLLPTVHVPKSTPRRHPMD